MTNKKEKQTCNNRFLSTLRCGWNEKKTRNKDFSLHFVAFEMTASLNEKGGRQLRRRLPPLNLTFSCHFDRREKSARFICVFRYSNCSNKLKRGYPQL